MFPVEIRIRDAETLTQQMTEMRQWLDNHRFEPATFRYTSASRIIFWVHFTIESEAVAFAEAFGGSVIATPGVFPAQRIND